MMGSADSHPPTPAQTDKFAYTYTHIYTNAHTQLH